MLVSGVRHNDSAFARFTLNLGLTDLFGGLTKAMHTFSKTRLPSSQSSLSVQDLVGVKLITHGERDRGLTEQSPQGNPVVLGGFSPCRLQ